MAGLGPDGNITPLTPEQVKERRGRSLAIAWALVFLAILFAAVTYVRLGDNMLKQHQPAPPAGSQSGTSGGTSGSETKDNNNATQ